MTTDRLISIDAGYTPHTHTHTILLCGLMWRLTRPIAFFFVFSSTMREHLENTAPIVRDLEPAPATKRAMLRREAARRLPAEALVTPANAGKPKSSHARIVGPGFTVGSPSFVSRVSCVVSCVLVHGTQSWPTSPS